MKKISIFPGTFNFFHVGHLNILEQAEAIFGKENVIISVGNNPQKKEIISPVGLGTTALYTSEIDRVATIKHNLPSKNIEEYSGLLTDYIWEKEKLGFDVTVVRGLRNGDDLQFEVNQLRFLQAFKPDIKVVFLYCDKEFSHISSSACKILEKIKQSSSYQYIAKEIK